MDQEIIQKKLTKADQKVEILEKMIEDITRNLYEKENELQETQDQLIKAERLSTAGQMAAGIAHELNNPMMGILNYVQYCLKHTPKEDSKYTILQDSVKEVKRCIELLKNFLAFSHIDPKGLEESYEEEDCNVVLEKVLKLLSFQIEDENIVLNKNISHKIPKLWMRVNNIEQVFVNLLTNAIDALRQISKQDKKDRKKELIIDISQKGKFVQIIIADNGVGIPVSELPKIFNPFFTTKLVGKGTGLGLSICQNIINSHGGSIKCESEEGVGTKFTILLPIERKKTS